MRLIKTLLFVTVLSALPLKAQETALPPDVAATATISFPTRIGFVNDLEGIFTPQQSTELEEILSSYEKKTGKKIVVASLSTITPFAQFDEYARQLSEKWEVGSADRSDGLSVMFSKSLRQIRISTGYGENQSLTNEACKNIIDTVIIPEFKKGDFYNGVKLGVQELIKIWQ